MHLKKMSIVALAAFMGVSIIPSISFASEAMENKQKEILNEMMEDREESQEEKNKKEIEELYKKVDKDKVLVIPENEKERQKLIVKEDEEGVVEDSSSWAKLKKPELKSRITTRSVSFYGSATPDAKLKIVISYEGTKDTFKLEADDEGFFGGVVPLGYFAKGTTVQVYEYDGDKKSDIEKVVVEKGVANAPMVAGVTNYCDYVLGKTNAINDEGFVEINGKVYTCGSVDSDGYFYVDIPRQKVGTLIKVYTKDVDGEKSPVYNTVVEKGFTFKELPKLTTNTKTITGKTIPFAEVYCRTYNTSYEATADKNGNFKINLDVPLKSGKNMIFQAYDVNGFVYSEEVLLPILQAPKKPNVKNSRITVNTTKITGTAGKGCTVYVKVNSKYYKSKVTADGKFSVTIPKQKKGTKVSVYAKSSKGANSNKVEFITASSATAPLEPTVSTISVNTTTVKGKGTAGTTATVRVGNKYYRSTVAKDGSFSIKIPKLKKGTAVKIYLKNKKGEYSVVVNMKVVAAPNAPKDIYVYEYEYVDGKKGTGIEGTSGKNTIVYAKVGDKYYKSDVVDDTNYFEIELPSLKNGTKIKLYSKNANTGATSKVITITKEGSVE